LDAAYAALVCSLSPPSICLAPTGLTAGTATTSSIPVSWTAPANSPSIPITAYLVQWGTTSGVYTNQATVSGSQTSYTINGLSFGTTYFITVTALSSYCSSTRSAELSSTTPYSAEVVAWANRVVANGGALPSTNTRSAAPVC